MNKKLEIGEARALYVANEAPKARRKYPLIPNLERTLWPGFLLPYLWSVDRILLGRWDYWREIEYAGQLPREPIPRIDFESDGHSAKYGLLMWNRCLDSLGQTISDWERLNYMLDWILFGFGYTTDEPNCLIRTAQGEARNSSSMRLYQLFDLWPLLLWPYDHLADILAENSHGRRSGFFPTPHPVVELMTQINFSSSEENRNKTTTDPACGTGRMLLHASNHSLRLSGQDIDPLVVKCSLVNAYIYAPWMAIPFRWDKNDVLVKNDGLRISQMDRILAATEAEIDREVAQKKGGQ